MTLPLILRCGLVFGQLQLIDFYPHYESYFLAFFMLDNL